MTYSDDRDRMIRDLCACRKEIYRLQAEVEDLKLANAPLYNDRIENLEREIQRLRVDAWCDVCCGKGTLESGRECICGGTGRIADALHNLRVLYVGLVEALGSRGREGCPECHGSGRKDPEQLEERVVRECPCRKELGL